MTATRRRGADVPAARLRRGMTLVEIIVAMMILTGVVLVLGAFTARFTQASGQAQLIITANELAASRLDEVRTQPTYVALDTLAHSDTVVANLSKYLVRTDVKRVGGAAADTVDYKLVTVSVTHPQMKKTISKTTAVAAF